MHGDDLALELQAGRQVAELGNFGPSSG